MLIKNIRIFEQINDIENDCVDVCLDCEDNYTFTVSIATTKYILEKMDLEKINFSKPRDHVIVVRKLTQEIITEALQEYAEGNAFWLKLYQFAGEIDISVLDELQAKHRKELIKVDLLCGLEDLANDINKLDKLNNTQKSNFTARVEKLAQLLDSE